ncbi:MAG: AMP-binding protein, partial [Clostridia bacterium]|nr:AMP-binding protein [Clostridia bacterium]
EAFTEDGWFRTGDLGNIGSDGNIRITGRAKNVIVTSNGKNIYPEEIEYYLNRNPFIAESMVVGSDKSGEDDTVVEAKIFPDLDAIRKHFKDDHEPTEEEVNKTIGKVVREINKKLPNYKNIQDFSIRSSEFVKTTTAKIKRFAEENLSEAKNYYESKKKENK